MSSPHPLRPWPLHREQLDVASAVGDVAHTVRMTWRRATFLARVALVVAGAFFVVGACAVAAGAVVASLAVGGSR